MTTVITTIQGTDLKKDSRATINDNFDSLNTNKIETSVLDTDTTLAANSDSKIASQKAIKAYVDALGGQTFLVPTGGILPYAGSSAPSNYLLCDGSLISRSTYATLFGVIGTTFGAGDGSTTFQLPNLKNRIPVGAGAATVVATFASRASNVITVTGLTNNSNNEFQTGRKVTYHTTGSVITGLTNDTDYYIVRVTNTTFSLATSLANAQNGTVISLSSDGSGTQTFTHTMTTRALGEYGGEENHAMSSAELLAHTHSNQDGLTTSSYPNGGGTTATGVIGGSGGHSIAGSTGGNTAMNNMQPFVIVNYIIKY
jgi:microcystin-dependent protein